MPGLEQLSNEELMNIAGVKSKSDSLDSMSNEELMNIAGVDNTKPNIEKNNSNLSTALQLGGGAAIFGGGAYGVGRYLNTPNRLIKPIDAQLQGIAQKEFPGEKISSSDIPTLLRAKHNVFKTENAVPDTNTFNKTTSLLTKEIRNNKNLFDNKVLNPAIDDISNHIAKNYKIFTNSAYEQYKTGLDNIASIIEKSGTPLQSQDINTNLISKTISDAIQQGVPEDKLRSLSRLADKLDASPGDSIPFSQIKGTINSLTNELPDKAKYILSDNWNTYLSKSAPEEVLPMFKELQSKYAPFAQARNALYDLVDTNSGTFDTKKLSQRLRMLSKNNQDAGVLSLLDVMSKGSDIAQPIPGLSDKVSQLKNLSTQRLDYANQLLKIDKAKLEHAQSIEQAKTLLKNAEQSYSKTLLETQKLLSSKNSILEKYAGRTAISNALKVLSKKAISGRGLIAGAGAVGIAASLTDPVGAAESFIGGSTDVGTAEVKPNNLTDFEWDSKGKLHREIIHHPGKKN